MLFHYSLLWDIYYSSLCYTSGLVIYIFHIICSNLYLCVSCLVISDCLRPHGLQPTRLLCPWDSPGKNTAVGYHFLLQGIFWIQELNPGLPHCRQILYQLSYQRSLCWPQIPNLSLPPHFSPLVTVCYLCLWTHLCFINKFIFTIF